MMECLIFQKDKPNLILSASNNVAFLKTKNLEEFKEIHTQQQSNGNLAQKQVRKILRNNRSKKKKLQLCYRRFFFSFFFFVELMESVYYYFYLIFIVIFSIIIQPPAPIAVTTLLSMSMSPFSFLLHPSNAIESLINLIKKRLKEHIENPAPNNCNFYFLQTHTKHIYKN